MEEVYATKHVPLGLAGSLWEREGCVLPLVACPLEGRKFPAGGGFYSYVPTSIGVSMYMCVAESGTGGTGSIWARDGCLPSALLPRGGLGACPVA